MGKLNKRDAVIILSITLLLGVVIGWQLNSRKVEVEHVDILKEIEFYERNEKAFNALVESQLNEIEELSNKNDSIEILKDNIDKKRIINYKKYQNEVERNKRIVTVNDANIVIDSILRSKGFR